MKRNLFALTIAAVFTVIWTVNAEAQGKLPTPQKDSARESTVLLIEHLVQQQNPNVKFVHDAKVTGNLTAKLDLTKAESLGDSLHQALEPDLTYYASGNDVHIVTKQEYAQRGYGQQNNASAVARTAVPTAVVAQAVVSGPIPPPTQVFVQTPNSSFARVPEPTLPEGHPDFHRLPGIACGASWKGVPQPEIGIMTVGWYKRVDNYHFRPVMYGDCGPVTPIFVDATYFASAAGVYRNSSYNSNFPIGAYPANYNYSGGAYGYGGYGYGSLLDCSAVPTNRNCTHGDLKINADIKFLAQLFSFGVKGEEQAQKVIIKVDGYNKGPVSMHNSRNNPPIRLTVGPHVVQFVQSGVESPIVYETEVNIESTYVQKGQPDYIRIDASTFASGDFRRRFLNEEPGVVPVDEILRRPASVLAQPNGIQ